MRGTCTPPTCTCTGRAAPDGRPLPGGRPCLPRHAQGIVTFAAHHGDRDARRGLIDLAVNVRAGAPPPWLRQRPGRRRPRAPTRTAAAAHAASPRATAARWTRCCSPPVPPRHSSFWPGRCARAGAVVVHPQFTEPERAAAGRGARGRARRPGRTVPARSGPRARGRRPGRRRQSDQSDLGAASGRRAPDPGPAGTGVGHGRGFRRLRAGRAGLSGRRTGHRGRRGGPQPDQDVGAGRIARRLSARPRRHRGGSPGGAAALAGRPRRRSARVSPAWRRRRWPRRPPGPRT